MNIIRKTAFALMVSLSVRGQIHTVQVKPPQLRYVRFVDSSNGWIAGLRGTYHSTDGGVSWRRQVIVTPPAKEGRTYTPPYFLEKYRLIWQDATRVIVWTDDWVLFVSRGDSTAMDLPVSVPEMVRDLKFCDGNTGWLLARGLGLYRSNDGGKQWARIGATEPLVERLFPVSHKESWGFGRRGQLYHTIDGGETWRKQLLAEAELGGLRAIQMIGTGSGWILGSDGVHSILYRTSDGGQTWIFKRLKEHPGLNALSFTAEGEGWLAGSQGQILHTRDGGEHWESLSSGTTADFLDIQAMAGGKAWVVGQDGSALRTVDHGRTWQRMVVD